MGVMDAFEKEDRTQVKVSQLYLMLREAAKCELLMNAVNCNVPHKYIREMATGQYEKPKFLIQGIGETTEAVETEAENIE